MQLLINTACSSLFLNELPDGIQCNLRINMAGFIAEDIENSFTAFTVQFSLQRRSAHTSPSIFRSLSHQIFLAYLWNKYTYPNSSRYIPTIIYQTSLRVEIHFWVVELSKNNTILIQVMTSLNNFY